VTSFLYDSLEFFLIVYRNLRVSDFQNLSDNFFAFLEELNENPDLGLVLLRKKPALSEELEWFSNLYKNVEQGKIIATVAEADSKVVGLYEVEGSRADSDVAHGGRLGISIVKEYRRRGIGTELMRQTLEKCKGKFEVVELSVFSINKAKKLYERFGFQTFGHNPLAIKRNGKYYEEDLMLLKL
jgi:RimJ/RimL family protein N-acetyltransferase